ncbi:MULTISPECIES: phage tail length tape measure family protein [unclassified Rhizobium]|uniref:phage tail length tape measure family protein n=1 Tax=unclassified Rhizobium TaxID=2613769 RepID=UPI000BE9FE8C|nr:MULTISPECIES: phage tail length tape measure family protein [unclassified Rhizobium]MDF0659713.1 phage tail length tape measure family protein [Rhizobium sp. BC49]PDS85271.1 tail length tape measure protein [Rhizobium sp. L18]
MSDNTDDLIISISTDQATLRRSIKRIEQDLGTLAGSVQKQFSAVGKSIDNSVSSTLQNRINGMVGIGKAASKEWTGALADQGKELERLRARYNPLFATINNYKTAVAEIKQAHAIGAISANEMATAISKERQAALASTAAIKGRNAALAATPEQRAVGGGNAYQTANIAAQFQDIAVSLQGGSKPLTVALQQGTQLSSVLATMGSGRQIIAGLGAAFASLVSPVSLVTIGLIAAGGAAYQYFTSVKDGGDNSEKSLKKEAELIQSVADKWGSVLPELKKYADERQKLVDQKEQKDASIAAADNQWTELRKTIGTTTAAYAEFLQTFNDQAADTAKVGALQKAYKELSDGIANGTATSEQAKTVQEALLALMGETGIKAVGDFAKTFDGLATSIAGARSEADKFKSAPLFNENVEKSRLPALGTIGPVYSDNGKLITDPNEIDRYNKQQEDNRNPKIDTGRGVPVPVPLPTAKPIQLGEEPNKAAETAATKAANAYRDLQKAADDRIGQVQQEIDLLGKYGIEADAARFSLDLFQQAEDKGRSLSATQRAEIQKKVDLYKQYSETLSKAKLSQDLLNDMRYDSLSKEDQKVTTTLRQYGLPEDLNSEQAGQIRQSIKTGELREDLHSFASDFKNALLNNGGDIGKAFGDAIQNAALNQISKIADRFIDQIINGIIGSVSGQPGGATNGIAGAITGAIGGGSSGGAGVAATKAVVSSAGSAVDKAFTLFGANENTNTSSINSFLKQGGVDLNAAQTKWCAAFVNSSLEQVGIKGSGSQVANSFLDWGTKIDPSQILKGDVLVQNRGLGANQAGGHVGFATGATRYSGGQQQLEMLSGNLSDGVGKEWVSAMEVQARRATESAASLGGLTSSSRTAIDGLGQLGNGLNKFGNNLASAGAGGGGGGGGWLQFLLGTPFAGSGQLAASGGIGLFADGGPIRGPGGPTSDSIPIMASNEEFIVNARQSKKHRALLHAINNGTIGHFAAGGLVGSAGRMPALSPSGRAYGNDNVEIKIINNNGSKVSQTKRKTSSGQTIEMVIDDMVADKMSTPGSRSRSAVQSQFGLQGGLARR